MGFPLYVEDCHGNLAAFVLTGVKNDGKFLMAYYALVEAGFNINCANEDDLTFLQTLCLSGQLSMPKI
jgi:hypothetical protein